MMGFRYVKGSNLLFLFKQAKTSIFVNLRCFDMLCHRNCIDVNLTLDSENSITSFDVHCQFLVQNLGFRYHLMYAKIAAFSWYVANVH